MQPYKKFLKTKLTSHRSPGIDPREADLSSLFPHQSLLTQWALRKGKAAIFADTGLGKTRIQLVWADAVSRVTRKKVLILAPLAVAAQTVNEGGDIGIKVTHARDQSEVQPGINITNYDRIHRFNASEFGAVVLDESSIIKHHDAKTFALLLEMFRDIRYKLCATATPAPNDWTELGTHAEFLGIRSRMEMLSEYFVHDGGQTQVWRLKGHARKEFWRWVSSWGAMLRSPEDLGLDGSAYNLPPLHVHQVTVDSDAVADYGELFVLDAQTLSERRQARRESMRHRVAACAELANASSSPWIIWCDLNAEGEALDDAIPNAVEVRGSDTNEYKEHAVLWFTGATNEKPERSKSSSERQQPISKRVLISKPRMFGFGLNFQHCNRIAFVGVTDSWEAYYQAVRRCWRFGQTKPVHVYLFVSEKEGAVKANLERKEKDALAMLEALSQETSEAIRSEVLGQDARIDDYKPKTQILFPDFLTNGV